MHTAVEVEQTRQEYHLVQELLPRQTHHLRRVEAEHQLQLHGKLVEQRREQIPDT